MDAWHKLPTFAGGDHLRAWLYKVARFKAISFLRRRGPGGRPMDSIDHASLQGHPLREDEGQDPLRHCMHAEPTDPWIDVLRECLPRLPATYRGVVQLHYFHGHTAREVGRLLGIARPAVKMRLLRARKLLERMVLEQVEARRAR